MGLKRLKGLSMGYIKLGYGVYGGCQSLGYLVCSKCIRLRVRSPRRMVGI